MGRTRRCSRSAALLGFVIAAACAAVPPPDQTMGAEEAARRRMVETQIRGRGIENRAVLDAMLRVPRHLFIPESERAYAYDDSPVPIGFGQTISQPYIVAYMSDALGATKGHRVLEIGTGSGYQAAVLAEMGCEVWSIEIVPELAARAQKTLADLGYGNIHARHGDGYLGWPEEAPFDRVILTAAPPVVPKVLIDQLGPGGILIAPVGGFLEQTMTIVRKTDRGVVTEETIPVRFVPMVGGRGTE